MKVITDGFEIKVYCYWCGDCDERFYLEELVDNSHYDVHCPQCGNVDEVAISSGHLKELDEQEKNN